jgi:Flp pilus assembly protein TadD
MLGLILIACDAVRRWRPSRPALYSVVTAIALTFGGLCHARNRLWAKPELLIALAAEDARYNPRPLLNLAEALIRRNRCDLALPYLDRAERILPGSYFVHSIRGRALACMGRLAEAMEHLQMDARIRPCSQVYLWIGLLYGQIGRFSLAGPSLQKAVELDPNSGAAHGALALWYEATRNFAAAEREYAANLALDPDDATAWAGIERVRRMGVKSS